MKKIVFSAFIVALVLPQLSIADSSRPSAHAPISIMGDHLHNSGEWMFSYRFMHMDMQGSLIGSREISAQEIVGTGAYKLTDYDPGQRLVFKRNEHYWKKSSDGVQLPYIDK